jgi:hypothetical protein
MFKKVSSLIQRRRYQATDATLATAADSTVIAADSMAALAHLFALDLDCPRLRT